MNLVKNLEGVCLPYLLIFILFTSCYKIDYTDPVEVIRKYEQLGWNGEFSEQYQLLSDSTKQRVTESEFIASRKNQEHKENIVHRLDTIILTYMNPLFPNFRNYEITYMPIDGADEILISSLGVSKEGTNWAVIWYENIIDKQVDKLIEDKHEFVTNQTYALKHINPLCVRCFEVLSWRSLMNGEIKIAQQWFDDALEVSPSTIDPLLGLMIQSYQKDSILHSNDSFNAESFDSRKIPDEKLYKQVLKNLIEYENYHVALKISETSLSVYSDRPVLLQLRAEILYKMIVGFQNKLLKKYRTESKPNLTIRERRYYESKNSLFSDPRFISADSSTQVRVIDSFFEKVVAEFIEAEYGITDSQKKEKLFVDFQKTYAAHLNEESFLIDSLNSVLNQITKMVDN